MQDIKVKSIAHSPPWDYYPFRKCWQRLRPWMYSQQRRPKCLWKRHNAAWPIGNWD